MLRVNLKVGATKAGEPKNQPEDWPLHEQEANPRGRPKKSGVWLWRASGDRGCISVFWGELLEPFLRALGGAGVGDDAANDEKSGSGERVAVAK